jgi:hypothetical protein
MVGSLTPAGLSEGTNLYHSSRKMKLSSLLTLAREWARQFHRLALGFPSSLLRPRNQCGASVNYQVNLNIHLRTREIMNVQVHV